MASSKTSTPQSRPMMMYSFLASTDESSEPVDVELISVLARAALSPTDRCDPVPDPDDPDPDTEGAPVMFCPVKQYCEKQLLQVSVLDTPFRARVRSMTAHATQDPHCSSCCVRSLLSIPT